MESNGDIISRYGVSFRANAGSPALTDYFTGRTRTYLEVASEIRRLHIFFSDAGIRCGDKVALVGGNTSEWVIIYMSIVTYGAVVVPVLQDFNPADVANIIDHSDSALLFADSRIWRSVSSAGAVMSGLRGVISTEDFSVLKDSDGTVTHAMQASCEKFKSEYPDGFRPEDIYYSPASSENVMIISYTSGTTGFSKGVMLTVGNITSNVNFALEHRFHYAGSRVLALLPLAHAYGCAFDMLTPLATGSHITLLGRVPSPSILVSALKSVRPHLVCTVPLVMEKIVRRNVLPLLEKQPARLLLHIPGVRHLVFNRVRACLLDAFGGCITEVNMGGAAVSADVEDILRKIRFPYSVGYGMTECGPLISYEYHTSFKFGSCGRILPGMEVRVNPLESADRAGEICVRGLNVMAGYYKDPDATAAAVDSNGWLHTGDIGIVDPDGTIRLRGRCKSMILSSSGQNIYPEEIEAKLNELPLVSESLIYEENGKITALIVPDMDEIGRRNMAPADIAAAMDENIRVLNTLVAPYERVASCKLCSAEFEKTPKRSIKRYLYPKRAVLLSL